MGTKKNNLPFLIIVLIVVVVLKMNGGWSFLMPGENSATKDQRPGLFNLTEYNNKKLFDKAYAEKDYKSAALYGEQLAISYQNDSIFLKKLAHSYFEIKNYDYSAQCFEKLLSINPNDITAKNNLAVVNRYLEENRLNTALNSVSVREKAPSGLYSLIQADTSPEIRQEVEGILDILWHEPSGKALLDAIWQKQVPIRIVDNGGAVTRTTIYSDGRRDIEVLIPVDTIHKLNDSTLSPHLRIWAFNTFMHEFGHVFCRVNSPRSFNSMEEELGISMLGYNIAYKIVTGEYLTKEQTKMYSIATVQAILSDKHRELPVYSGFNKRMQGYYSIKMPYPEEYSDIALIYKKLLLGGKVANVASLDKFIN